MAKKIKKPIHPLRKIIDKIDDGLYALQEYSMEDDSDERNMLYDTEQPCTYRIKIQ